MRLRARKNRCTPRPGRLASRLFVVGDHLLGQHEIGLQQGLGGPLRSVPAVRISQTWIIGLCRAALVTVQVLER